MRAASVIREARRRAGLTQSGLAARLGTTQSAIARLESGATEPAFGRVLDAVRACGLELTSSLVARDDSDWSVASFNLTLRPDERVRRHQAALRLALAGREAMLGAR